MTDSRTLLADYAKNGSEGAFRELVARYLNLVYATAMRVVGGDATLAEDVAQTVFIDLVRHAHSLPRDVMLGGWLHRDTFFVAAKLVRTERRRRLRERQAVEMNSHTDHSEANLAAVAPLLDEAINKLAALDRTAIILRFFEQRDLRGVGEALGASENAAQKRVSRALEELRVLLRRRGVVLSAGALSTLLATESIAAPGGLALSISTTALGASAGGTGALTLVKLMALTKTNIGIAGVCIVAGLGSFLVIYHQAQAGLREQWATLQQQAHVLAQLEAQNGVLAPLTNRFAGSGINDRENLMRLRREVGLLRAQTNALSGLQEESRRLRDAQKTPLQMVEESRERGILRMNYARGLMLAFHQFAADHGGQFPASFDQAASLLSSSKADEAEMTPEQFEIVYRGTQNALSNPASIIVVREKEAWSDYTGQFWGRTYGFADGHSEIHKIRGVTNAAEAARADAEPDVWEKQHMASPPGP